jgi:hypothetical protein
MADVDLMAHFAELDADNAVIRVIAVDNDVTIIDGVEVEQRGIDHLAEVLPGSGPWVQTSYNANFRSFYAGDGHIYDADRDAFIRAQPFPSWTLDEDTHLWEPPVARLFNHDWDEDTLSFVLPDSPYPSWVWDYDLGCWRAPVAQPDDGKDYEWDEGTTSWVN